MSIALNMIIGKWEEPFLEASLMSTIEVCDEWVIIDTSPRNNPNRSLIDLFAKCFNNNLIGRPELEKYGVVDNPVKIIDMERGEDKDFSFAAARELARVNTDSKYVLRIDADEVLHENTIPEIKLQTEKIEIEGYSGLACSFYHLMCYPHLFQYQEVKQIIFETDRYRWVGGVHEHPIRVNSCGPILQRHNIKYIHYGYLRGEAEVLKRWKLYTDIDGKPNYYDGVNPNTILQDRIAVCQNFPKEGHPKVVHETLDRLFPNWREES